MTHRVYSLDEIDRMRTWVRYHLQWTSPHGWDGVRLDSAVELQLHTYMLNSTLPDELEVWVQGRLKEYDEAREAKRKMVQDKAEKK